MSKREIIVTVAAWIFLALVAGFLASPARSDPQNGCAANGQSSWSNPCTAKTPPWWSNQWRPTNGIGGTYGPGGYTPCRIQEGCKQ